MYLTDFVYDGVKLSSLGYLVGNAVSSNNDSASAGSKLDLQTVVNRGNNLTQIITAQYNEPITVTFDIIKYACTDTADTIVDDNEISFMMRWLNQTTYCKFFPIYNDLSLPNVYFKGTFTEINTVQLGGNVVGFSLTFSSNAPYGFIDYDTVELTIVNANGSCTYYDESDEYGINYPEQMVLTIGQSGNLEFLNELTQKTTIIENCLANEVITFDCIHRIITTDSSTHMNTLHKDFNYVFPHVSNTKATRENTFTSNLPCQIALTYAPIRKVGIVV